MSFPQYMVLKKGPLPLYLFMLHQKRAPIFYTWYTKILRAESNLNFSFCLEMFFCGKVHFTFKLFEVILFYVVLCLPTKVVKGAPLEHIFALFWKIYDFLQSLLLLQSGSSAFKQNNAKTKYESLKEGPHDISEKRGPSRQPCSPSLISTPALNYNTKERTGFIL